MQDEMNEKVIALYIKGGKITAKLLQRAIRIFLAEIKKQEARRQLPHGKQSLKQLMKQNAGVFNIEITDENIKAFEADRKEIRNRLCLKKRQQHFTAPPPCIFQRTRCGCSKGGL